MQAGQASSSRFQNGYHWASASTTALSEFPHTEHNPSVFVD